MLLLQSMTLLILNISYDQPHKDLERARSSSMSLIPTSTGSAKAIGTIFPGLEGKSNGLAVRVPLANASQASCVFEDKLKKQMLKKSMGF